MPSEPLRTKEERKEQSRLEDRQLVERAKRGDQRAFFELEKKYRRAIHSLVSRMLRTSPDTEDLLQEIFVKSFSAIATFNQEYAFSTWLYKIASNHCIDYLRKKRLKTFSISKPAEGGGEGEGFFEIADVSYLPDAPLQTKERQKILLSAIEELPDKYKTVIRMRHDEDMDYQQIADILELPLGTVKAHLFRARAMLYKKLKDHQHHFTQSQA